MEMSAGSVLRRSLKQALWRPGQQVAGLVASQLHGRFTVERGLAMNAAVASPPSEFIAMPRAQQMSLQC